MKRVGDDRGRGGLERPAGHSGPLIVLGDELDDVEAPFGASADCFVYLGSYPTPGAAAAAVVLPITTFAEEEGSFTNHAGIVQRYEPALRPPGMARPAAAVLETLVEALGSPAGAIAGNGGG
jgi:NADH dehydrogenase/NADH:ubiquinone oxidoreductase subunit G